MLSDIFDPQRIKLDLKGTTKTGVLMELADVIAASDPRFDSRKLFEAITERESKKSTIIMPGVAVPHGYCGDVQGIIGAMGYSRAGIEYDDLDKEPVHLIFLILMDESSREKHLKTLTRLLELLNSPGFREIHKTGSPEEVFKLLSRY